MTLWELDKVFADFYQPQNNPELVDYTKSKKTLELLAIQQHQGELITTGECQAVSKL